MDNKTIGRIITLAAAYALGNTEFIEAIVGIMDVTYEDLTILQEQLADEESMAYDMLIKEMNGEEDGN